MVESSTTSLAEVDSRFTITRTSPGKVFVTATGRLDSRETKLIPEPLTIETAPVSVSVRVAGRAGVAAKTVEAATAMMMTREICLTYFFNFLPR
jgi:hypothetical protein